MAKKAVFLDRDGVLNKTLFKMGKQRAPYTLEEFEFCDGVFEAIKLLREHDFLLVMVTNQPDVARGWVTREAVDDVNNHIQSKLNLDAIKVCWHTDIDKCICRKPKPGMLLEAATELDIDLKVSFMIGDRPSDIEAGHEAGCKTIWLSSDSQKEHIQPDYQTSSLLEGSRWIIVQ